MPRRRWQRATPPSSGRAPRSPMPFRSCRQFYLAASFAGVRWSLLLRGEHLIENLLRHSPGIRRRIVGEDDDRRRRLGDDHERRPPPIFGAIRGVPIDSLVLVARPHLA